MAKDFGNYVVQRYEQSSGQASVLIKLKDFKVSLAIAQGFTSELLLLCADSSRLWCVLFVPPASASGLALSLVGAAVS